MNIDEFYSSANHGQGRGSGVAAQYPGLEEVGYVQLVVVAAPAGSPLGPCTIFISAT